jgi:apolipoprotein N-acyltransferase
VRSLPLGSEGVLDATLPRPIAATVYARIGDLWLLIVVVLTMASALALRLFR